MRLFTRNRDRDENCLAGFTPAEFQQAATRLDAGDQGPADALVARAGEEHGRCVAMSVLRFCRDASTDQ